MTFLIVTHVLHKNFQGRIFAYGPYVREMNLWLKHVTKVIIVAPVDSAAVPNPIDIAYDHSSIIFRKIPKFDILSIKNITRTVLMLLHIVLPVVWGMIKADHIHLRCPGNVGLIGSFVQVLFPRKVKSAKYAGNWDWNSHQPWSYRLQQRILSNTFLTRNMTVLVYGDWPDKTRNIKTFFTATYSETERIPVAKRPLSETINLAFVGMLTENKSPRISLDVLKGLIARGNNVTLSICGEGPERIYLEQKIMEYGLQDKTILLGNVNAEKVKEVLIKAHFLIFISRSEGWPKAVSEAMWWGCIPITTPVSCVPQMLGQGERGFLVDGSPEEIITIIENSKSDPDQLIIMSERAKEWARRYTTEKFDEEISDILKLPNSRSLT